MATKKAATKSEIENEKENETIENEISANEDTEAAHTIDAHPTVSRSEVMAMAAKALAEMPKQDLSKFWNETLAAYRDAGGGKGIPDGASARNKASLNTKSSSASDANLHTPLASIKAVQEDLQELLRDQENLPEEFTKRALVLFEAAVTNRVANEVAVIKDEQEKLLTEVKEQLTEQVDEYLDYAAQEFFEENKIAIESSLKLEMYEGFIDDLQELFAKHHIVVPEERTDVLDALAERVEELEDQLNSRTDELIQAHETLDAERASRVFKDVTKGLTDSDVEQFKKLAETVEFDGDETELSNKLKIIRESHFDKKKTSRRPLEERLADEGKVVTVMLKEDETDGSQTTINENAEPEIKAFAYAISRAEARKRL